VDERTPQTKRPRIVRGVSDFSKSFDGSVLHVMCGTSQTRPPHLDKVDLADAVG